MAAETKELTIEEFTSLLAIGNAEANDPVPVISAEHSAALIRLGCISDIKGRLRMPTSGRIRIACGLSN